jgi:hypothetical protein
MIGPGKYDNVCTAVREHTNAEGVLIIVLGGYLGNDFSAQLTQEDALKLPGMLRHIIAQLEADAPKLTSDTTN